MVVNAYVAGILTGVMFVYLTLLIEGFVEVSIIRDVPLFSLGITGVIINLFIDSQFKKKEAGG